jgi:Holliday junction DNA helicase RuvB
MHSRLDYYGLKDLSYIIERSSGLIGVGIDQSGCDEIAARARGTPRVANNLLRWVRDYAQVKSDGFITKAIADKALEMLDIDRDGLDEMDKRLLEVLVVRFQGGPVGLSSLAVSVGEDSGTVEEVNEPYLIQEGFIKRTAQGRVAMPKAYEKIGVPIPAKRQGELW